MLLFFKEEAFTFQQETRLIHSWTARVTQTLATQSYTPLKMVATIIPTIRTTVIITMATSTMSIRLTSFRPVLPPASSLLDPPEFLATDRDNLCLHRMAAIAAYVHTINNSPLHVQEHCALRDFHLPVRVNTKRCKWFTIEPGQFSSYLLIFRNLIKFIIYFNIFVILIYSVTYLTISYIQLT